MMVLYAILIAISPAGVLAQNEVYNLQIAPRDIFLEPRETKKLTVTVVNQSRETRKALLAISIPDGRHISVGLDGTEAFPGTQNIPVDLRPGSNRFSLVVTAAGTFNRSHIGEVTEFRVGLLDSRDLNRTLVGAIDARLHPSNASPRFRLACNSGRPSFVSAEPIVASVILTKRDVGHLDIPIPYKLRITASAGNSSILFADRVDRWIEGIIPAGHRSHELTLRQMGIGESLPDGEHHYRFSVMAIDVENDGKSLEQQFTLSVKKVRPSVAINYVNGSSIAIVTSEQLTVPVSVTNSGANTRYLSITAILRNASHMEAGFPSGGAVRNVQQALVMQSGQSSGITLVLAADGQLRAEHIIEAEPDDGGTHLQLTAYEGRNFVCQTIIPLRFDASRQAPPLGSQGPDALAISRRPARVSTSIEVFNFEPVGIANLLPGNRSSATARPGDEIWVRFNVENGEGSNIVLLRDRFSKIDNLLAMQDPPVFEEDALGEIGNQGDRSVAEMKQLMDAFGMIGLATSDVCRRLEAAQPFIRGPIGWMEAAVDRMQEQPAAAFEDAAARYFRLQNDKLQRVLADQFLLLPPNSRLRFRVRYRIPITVPDGNYDLDFVVKYFDTRRIPNPANSLFPSIASQTGAGFVQILRDNQASLEGNDAAGSQATSEARGGAILRVVGNITLQEQLSVIDEMLGARRYSEARTAASTLLDGASDPNMKAAALLRRGRAELEDLDLDRNLVSSRVSLENYVTHFPEHSEINEGRLYLGIVLQKLGEFEDALMIYGIVMSENPGTSAARRASANREVILDRRDHSVRRLIEDARRAIRDRRYNDAARTLEILVTSYPQSERIAEALFLSGQAYEAAGADDRALESYAAVIERYRTSSWAAEAERCKSALISRKSEPEQLIVDARAALARRDFLSAIEKSSRWLDRYKDRYPSRILDVREILAMSLKGEVRNAEAIRAFREIIDGFPLDNAATARARYAIAEILLLQQLTEEAEKAFEQVVVMNGGTAEAGLAREKLAALQKELSALALYKLEVVETDGDGPVFNAGDRSNLSITIKNGSRRRLTGLSVSFTGSTNSALGVDEMTIPLGEIEPDASRIIPRPCRLTVAPSAMDGQAAVRFRITDSFGNTSDKAVRVRLAAAGVPAATPAIAAANPQQDQFARMMQALVQIGMDYYGTKMYLETGIDPSPDKHIEATFMRISGGVTRGQQLEQERARIQAYNEEVARQAAANQQEEDQRRSIENRRNADMLRNNEVPSGSNPTTATQNQQRSIFPPASTDSFSIQISSEPRELRYEFGSKKEIRLTISLTNSGVSNFSGTLKCFSSNAEVLAVDDYNHSPSTYEQSVYINHGERRIFQPLLQFRPGGTDRNSGGSGGYVEMRLYDHSNRQINTMAIPITFMQPQPRVVDAIFNFQPARGPTRSERHFPFAWPSDEARDLLSGAHRENYSVVTEPSRECRAVFGQVSPYGWVLTVGISDLRADEHFDVYLDLRDREMVLSSAGEWVILRPRRIHVGKF